LSNLSTTTYAEPLHLVTRNSIAPRSCERQSESPTPYLWVTLAKSIGAKDIQFILAKLVDRGFRRGRELAALASACGLPPQRVGNSIREDGLLAIAAHGVIIVPGAAGPLRKSFKMPPTTAIGASAREARWCSWVMRSTDDPHRCTTWFSPHRIETDTAISSRCWTTLP